MHPKLEEQFSEYLYGQGSIINKDREPNRYAMELLYFKIQHLIKSQLLKRNQVTLLNIDAYDWDKDEPTEEFLIYLAAHTI